MAASEEALIVRDEVVEMSDLEETSVSTSRRLCGSSTSSGSQSDDDPMDDCNGEWFSG